MMKGKLKLYCILASFFYFPAVCAQQPLQLSAWRGFYVGLSIGVSTIDYQGKVSAAGVQLTKVNSTGLAPNIQLGYSFNRYIATELGVVYAKKPRFTVINNLPFAKKIKQNIVYLVAKASLPMGHKFALFAKGGVGYVVRDAVVYQHQTLLQEGEFTRPVYGVGLNYRPALHWIIDVSWMATPPRKGILLPSMNFVGLGAQYIFPW